MGISKMKWEQDLVKDIRTGTAFDDRDEPYTPQRPMLEEVTESNRTALTERFLRMRDKCTAILEIGVCRNKEQSHTYCFLNNKKQDTIYVGIDLEDKSFLNDKEQNIYTIRNNSSDFEKNMELIRSFGVEKFDFIFIDGWHSINQCYDDWEYSSILSDHGVVAFHDVSYHPGPLHFIQAIDKTKWNVEENVCPLDYGLGFAWKK
jgi:hypothetical protein